MAATNLGKVAITPRGAYNAETAYIKLDSVSYQGSSWLVLKPCTGVTPIEGEYYTLLAERGTNGVTPEKGVDYDDGADGKSLIPRGEYSAEANYVLNDVVSYQGSSYIVLQPCIRVTPVVGEYYMLNSATPSNSDSIEEGSEHLFFTNERANAAIDAKFADGITLTNKVVNGSFENGLDGWDRVGTAGSVVTTHKAVGASSLKLSSTTQTYYRQDIVFPDGHLIWCSAYIFVESTSRSGHKLMISEYGGITQQTNKTAEPDLGVWQRLSVIAPAINGGIRFMCGQPASITTTTYYVDGCIAIDLTAEYGVTTLEDFEAHLVTITPDYWFDGVMDIPSPDDKKLITSIGNTVRLADYSEISVYTSPLKGKTIVNFGDSIFANTRPPNDVSTYLAELSGATVYNAAFGGSRMGQHSGGWDAWSMYRLAHALVNNSYTLQDAALLGEDRPAHAADTLAGLKAIDFNTVDYITINHGTNDWSGSNVLDNTGDPDDTTTYLGALRYALELLMTAYPRLQIAVVSPAWRYFMDESDVYTEDSDTKKNTNNVTLPGFVTGAQSAASEFHCMYIDCYNIGINRHNRAAYFLPDDGTHHNQTGRQRIAAVIEARLAGGMG